MVERKKRKNRGEGGFTLVELLVVVAILAILVAVVAANFTGLLGGAQQSAADTELDIVQTAVDVKMAAENMATWAPVITQANATNDMTSAAGGFDLYPDYMRDQTTNGTYYVDATGQVSQDTTGY